MSSIDLATARTIIAAALGQRSLRAKLVPVVYGDLPSLMRFPLFKSFRVADPPLGVAARTHAGARQQFRDALGALALRRVEVEFAHSPATSTKARKIRRSASFISNSGCH